MSNGLSSVNSSNVAADTVSSQPSSLKSSGNTFDKALPDASLTGQELRTASMPNFRRLITADERKFAPSFLLDELFHGLPKS